MRELSGGYSKRQWGSHPATRNVSMRAWRRPTSRRSGCTSRARRSLAEVARLDRLLAALVRLSFHERVAEEARHLVAAQRPRRLEHGCAERVTRRSIPVGCG